MAILRRKWAATAAAWLSFSAMALIWLVWAFDLHLQPSPFRSFTLSDDELQHLLKNLYNSSSFISSTTCKAFLLEGAALDPIANVGSRQLGVFEWEGGDWFNLPDAINYVGIMRQTSLDDGGGLYEAAFSVTPSAIFEVNEWGNLADLVRPFGGHLVLKEFWNFYGAGDPGYRVLKLLLHGAFVSTGVDRRVCMSGCAFRLDYPNERDCEFVLKMKYPKRPSLATARVEGELSSARRPGDPLYLPAVRILGPRPLTGSEYEFRSESFLQTALNMSSSLIDHNGNASPKDLASYLECSEAVYMALVTPTPTEKSQIREQGKVFVGPFSSRYDRSQKKAFDSTVVAVVLRFKSVVTRLTTSGRRVLVSASMTVSLSCYGHYSALFVDQETLFNVEGIWDPVSEDLCMIGSREDEIFPWKLCLKWVLRKRVSIDSPLEGAVLSGPNFASLWLPRRGADSHQHYRYTVVAKAEELARRATPPEFEALGDTRWFHPRFPGPFDVPGVCRAAEKLRSTLSSLSISLLYGADGEVVDVFVNGFEVTFLESCGGPLKSSDVPWDTPLQVPVAGSYLRVAALLSLVRRSDAGEEVIQTYTPWQGHAEGVYEPFTGRMHLVVHQRQSERVDGVTLPLVAIPWPLERNGGGDVQAVEDSEIYMQLQFPSEDRTMSSVEEEALDPDPGYPLQEEYIHRFKVNVWVESLRPQSDPLYFKPLVAKNYPNYKPSP